MSYERIIVPFDGSATERGRTDLIVMGMMGTHGRRGITRLLPGSDTKTAVRASTAAHE